MNYSQNENHATADIDNWYFDGETPETVSRNAEQPIDRRVLFGCSLVGMIGVTILLIIVAGSSPDLALRPLSG